MKIDVTGMEYEELGRCLRSCTDPHVQIHNCCGQRYIANGMQGRDLEIWGTPGNALGAYLDGGSIRVHGNAQDAVGDTMNAGTIWVEGRAGDAAGYAMRGGTLMIRGDVGYRAGVHMKAFGNSCASIVIGGTAGSFLGEYQAGGVIVVLGLGAPEGQPVVGGFCGRGMYGGHIYLRGNAPPRDLTEKILCRRAQKADKEAIRPLLEQFCAAFGEDLAALLNSSFWVLEPNPENQYSVGQTGDHCIDGCKQLSNSGDHCDTVTQHFAGKGFVFHLLKRNHFTLAVTEKLLGLGCLREDYFRSVFDVGGAWGFYFRLFVHKAAQDQGHHESAGDSYGVGDDVAHITVVGGICQCNAGQNGGPKAHRSQIGKVNHDAAQRTADQRIAVAQVYAEDSRLGDAEQHGNKAGNTHFTDFHVFAVPEHVAQDRTALSNDGNGHEGVQEIATGIRQKLGLNGTEDMMQAGDDYQLLAAGEHCIAHRAQVLGHPDQNAGQTGGQAAPNGANDREQKQSAHQSCQQGRKQKPDHLGDLPLKEFVQAGGEPAHGRATMMPP